jgi:hypothetical protein
VNLGLASVGTVATAWVSAGSAPVRVMTPGIEIQALTLGTVVAYSLIGTAGHTRDGTEADHRHPLLTRA